MPDWTPLRLRARACHFRLRPDAAGNEAGAAGLLPATELLARAEADTGLWVQPVPPNDALLAGASALLDRASGGIWVADSGDPAEAPLRHFILAHEFAHAWLHPSLDTDPIRLDADQLEMLFFPAPGVVQVAEGYSPVERREVEANQFAAEFLLPAPLLRHAFITLGWNAREIAEHVGVPESLVRAQLMHALLLPERAAAEAAESAPPIGLDASQRLAAEIEAGPVLVDAGPGTGKTRTLIARILHLLTVKQVRPENILALTFSNKAAEEMRTRLRGEVGDTADLVWMGTFHAFGYELLKKDGGRIGLPARPRLLDTTDAVLLLERRLDILNLREYEYLHDPTLPFPDILGCISRAKDECKPPEAYLAAARAQQASATDESERTAADKALEIAHIYAVYQGLLAQEGLLDFGDLIFRAVTLLDHCPDVRARWQAQFPHLLADEYQDINRASAYLIQRLAGDGRGLWAVGDLRQAIYRFRGASPANVEAFETDFPGGRRLRLEINYRSVPDMVSLFSRAASATHSGPADTPASPGLWQPSRSGGEYPAVTVAVAEDEEAQADGLAARIRAAEAAGVAPGDQAILCTTNAQIADLSQRLEQRGIPTQHLGNLLDRPEVKDMLALLSLACEPDGIGLVRVGRFPHYAIPPSDVDLLRQAARDRSLAFPGALGLAADLAEISPPGRAGLARLRRDLEPIAYRGGAWSVLSRYLFETGDYLRPLLTSASTEDGQKCVALHQLLHAAQNMTARLEMEPVEDKRKAFLIRLRQQLLCGEGRSLRLPADMEALTGVRLMTVHQSKGLEFPIVYLPNLNNGQFPFRRSGGMAKPPPSLFEELSPEDEGADALFFVALSRARDQLVLSRPKQRNGRKAEVSSLLTELQPALDAVHAGRVDWNRSPAIAAPTPEPADPAAEGERAAEAAPSVTLAALEQYRDCPRRYWYQRVRELRPAAADSAYLLFHQSLREMQIWLRKAKSEGREPSEEDIEAQLALVWENAEGEPATAHARLLRRRARALMSEESLGAADTATGEIDMPMTAALPNGRVEVRADHAETMPDGTLRVTRRMRRRPKKDDHTDERLALLRHAARQHAPDAPITVSLQYPGVDEIREVAESPRYEPARLEKYNQALRGIQEGRFPPAPEERKCARCPFLFICPI